MSWCPVEGKYANVEMNASVTIVEGCQSIYLRGEHSGDFASKARTDVHTKEPYELC